MSKTKVKLLLYNPLFAKTMLIIAAVLLTILTTPHTTLAQAPAGGVSGGDDLLNSLASLTKAFVSFIIGASGLLLTIAVALGGFSGQYAALMGMPYAQASAGTKIASAVILFSVTAASIWIANIIIDAVGSLVSTGISIHIIR